MSETAIDTPSTRFLTAHGIAYTVHDYEYVSEPGKIGIQAAAGIGIDQEKVFKTLMVEIDKKQIVCAVIPVHQKMNLKKVAALFGGKNARMLNAEKAEALTGFQVGGISPFGARTQVPVVFENAALKQDVMYINGGGRGIVIGLSPKDAIACVNGQTADLTVDAT
ncbi:ATP-binding protein [Acetobacter senegalensis]|uniref:Cys-tRNA(Pro)/Cys-tRNA(Cys) deacylase n=1 Tax=Acetobacter senegalensis TaxID=446692 RepID=A0A149TYJ0_9PROT|nr:Cys-tRNA(Pro) deacylase [Acetobacter senegalensis]KXV58231.1 ATP-binding protein [Acetobacter senegalensis]